MKTITTNICCIILLMVLASCISDAPFKITGPTVPAQLNDGWDIASPEDVGISRRTLDSVHAQLISEDRFFNAKSLLVVKDGNLVFETYCRDLQDRDRYSNIQSATKSVTSLLLGVAYTEQYVDSLNQTLYSIIPDKFPAEEIRRSITIHHLLTMKSGLSFDNDVFSVEIFADEP